MLKKESNSYLKKYEKFNKNNREYNNNIFLFIWFSIHTLTNVYTNISRCTDIYNSVYTVLNTTNSINNIKYYIN